MEQGEMDIMWCAIFDKRAVSSMGKVERKAD